MTMMTAPLHPNEEARLVEVRATRLLDTPRDARFDEIVFAIAQLCRTPMAALSLVDEDRQWWKARVGIADPSIPRSAPFCALTILGSDMVIVSDTRLDRRFVNNPLVTGPPFVRFYAGLPLILESGLAIGGLCVADTQPRSLLPHQVREMTELRRQAVRLIEDGVLKGATGTR